MELEFPSSALMRNVYHLEEIEYFWDVPIWNPHLLRNNVWFFSSTSILIKQLLVIRTVYLKPFCNKTQVLWNSNCVMVTFGMGLFVFDAAKEETLQQPKKSDMGNSPYAVLKTKKAIKLCFLWILLLFAFFLLDLSLYIYILWCFDQCFRFLVNQIICRLSDQIFFFDNRLSDQMKSKIWPGWASDGHSDFWFVTVWVIRFSYYSSWGG